MLEMSSSGEVGKSPARRRCLLTLLQSNWCIASACWDPTALAGRLGRGRQRSLDSAEASLLMYHTVILSNDLNAFLVYGPLNLNTMTKKCHKSLLKSI